jgi:hypothetical protein
MKQIHRGDGTGFGCRALERHGLVVPKGPHVSLHSGLRGVEHAQPSPPVASAKLGSMVAVEVKSLKLVRVIDAVSGRLFPAHSVVTVGPEMYATNDVSSAVGIAELTREV